VFERFSNSARRVVALAEDESRRLGHGQIGTEHLLLGILADGDSLAARALLASGATLDASRSKVAEAVGLNNRGSGAVDLELTDRAKRALERASRLALRRGDGYVETEHVLLTVLDVEGRAGQVLRGLAVDIASLRQAIVMATEERPDVPVAGSAPIEAVSPHCGACGSALDTALAHRVIASLGEAGQAQDFVVAYCSICGRVIGATAI
jgi:ATP-dependent Clp protease ATP-binding subunit ClpC